VLLTLVLVPLRTSLLGLGIDYSTVIGFLLYLLLTWYLLRRYRETSKVIVLAGVVIGSIVLFPTSIVEFINGRIWFLPQLAFQFLGILCGLLLHTLRGPVRFLPSAVGTALTILMFVWGFNHWLHYLSYDNFTGRVTPYKSEVRIDGVDRDGRAVSSVDFEGRIVVLNFWFTRCGQCIQEFPILDDFARKYSDSGSVLVYAVNKPMEEDRDKPAFDMLNEKGFRFPAIIPNDEDLPEKFGVKFYPTTFVIDQNGLVVFKGDLPWAIGFVDHLVARSPLPAN
jgi:thiol-disulfide isomerase/thioredoxin